MAPRKSKKQPESTKKAPQTNAYISGGGTVVEQRITDTLETNYMPYAMSVILSRALPEIDGFKPSHRKLLYTMYQMGLLKNAKTKSANIVGQTMRLNPHGDAAIYETMVRLTEGNEALLHPYVESKGNMGKAYSRDMAYAAARYTEAKLAPISEELFKDIDKDTVDMVDNYDASMKEPTLFPVTFPSILVNANTGIAVGMASSICSFNLSEVCRATIEYIKDENVSIADHILAPDFPGGGELLYDRDQIESVYSSGRGSIKVRSVYNYDKSANCIDITEIPPTTTVESIIEKIVDLVKLKKLTEINDIRDETDMNGLKITIDLKRGTDVEKLMQKLFKLTPLQDSFSANFNILIGGTPQVLGVKEIISEWVAFRAECVRRRVFFSLEKCKHQYHMLKGLEAILLDIDKAVRIVRKTEEEKEVVPNLMIGFGIDEEQAEHVAEIKLRHLNREYILKKLADVKALEQEIADLEDILKHRRKVLSIIIKELEETIKKHGQERKTKIVAVTEEDDNPIIEEVADYPVTLFFSREGYFKKITPQSLRMSGEQKLKENDEIVQTVEASNRSQLLFFTNQHQVYKAAASDFDDSKASVMGDYVASKLCMDKDEVPVYMAVTDDYSGNMLFFFENGRVAKVEMSAYQTKTNRKKLIKAYCDKFPICAFAYAKTEGEYLLRSTNGRMLLLSSAVVTAKSTKDTQGIMVMTQKRGQHVCETSAYIDGLLEKPHRYRPRTLPGVGQLLSVEERGEQLKFE